MEDTSARSLPLPMPLATAVGLRVRDRAITSHPRYRAAQRRGVLTAVRAGAVTVAVVQVADAVLLAPTTPDLLVINVPIAAVAVALLHVMRPSGSARRQPVLAVFLLGGLAVAATILPIVLLPDLAPRMVAYMPILVVASALFVPWATWWHVPWLLSVLVVAAAFDASALVRPLAEEGIGGLFPITLAGAITSLVGHVLLQRERRRAFAQWMQLRQLNQVAHHQRLELQALAGQLEAVARRDPLTGIGNRLRLDEDMGVMRRSIARSDDQAAAILLDIDHFKDYNDRHGHLAGDAVLRDVAWVIATNLRPDDRLYRFGGEEFLVLVESTDAAGAVLVAERLREAIAALGVTHEDNPPWGVVTASAGVATVRLGSGRADDWLREADERLYAAKAGGRNRVVGPPNPADGAGPGATVSAA